MYCTYIVARYRPAGNWAGQYVANVPKGKFDVESTCDNIDKMLPGPKTRRRATIYRNMFREAYGNIAAECFDLILSDYVQLYLMPLILYPEIPLRYVKAFLTSKMLCIEYFKSWIHFHPSHL